MSAGMDLLILVGAAFALVALVVYFVSIFNGLAMLKNNIGKSWANIDVLLTQRADELPNLVSTVKGYMAHEQKTLQAVTDARTALMNAKTITEKAGADNETKQAIKTLFAVAENYPNLKANENFLKLQGRITGLENEIADRREFYNDSVTAYNIRIQSIPDIVLAKLLKYTPEVLFKAEDGKRNPLQVKF
jgi:LemA protein